MSDISRITRGSNLFAPGALVDGLICMVARRDPETAIHLNAVGVLAARLARELEYDDDIVARVELGARLHDIGKTCLPLDVIHKPMTLTKDEWREMQLHPIYGASIVEGFAELAHTARIVRTHHERIDGRGYPDGVMGNDIPLEARIIAIADAFHAMTAARAYTAVQSPAAAAAEILRCAGTQFDAEFAEVFANMIGLRNADAYKHEGPVHLNYSTTRQAAAG